jgi:hypothetical protein
MLNARLKVGMSMLFPHETNVRLQFRQKHGYEPDLENPRTFNERVSARKLTLVQRVYRDTTDKLTVRGFVADRVGGELLIPLLQVTDHAEEIDLEGLPTPFILKPTHGSGWTKIVRYRLANERPALVATMRRWLRSNFFHAYFEIHYREIPPRIIAEPLLQTSRGEPPDDYRFFVFGGRVRVIAVVRRMRTPEATATWYDPLWRRLAVAGALPVAPVERPSALGQMIEIAEQLAHSFDFVRVDLYCVDGKVYFGELTHTPSGGLFTWSPPDFDAAMGAMWGSRDPLPTKYYEAPSGLTVQ